MSPRTDVIPVALFAYARPAHLQRVLACLRTERVPLVHAFADGAKGSADAAAVDEVRRQLRAIDWCEVRVTEREQNLGLGRNVRAGVGEMAAQYAAFVVWEDDLICVPGTYAWLSAALRHYADDSRVMSVTGWTHPEIKPSNVTTEPYFDARAECWVWGAYARSWTGMDRTAAEKMASVEAAGLAADAYGSDLPRMARDELRRNIWAVRWLFHHLEHGGLCLRPPWSLVEHVGFDALATNAGQAERWANPPLRPAPSIPARWPEPVEHAECRALWRKANPAVSMRARVSAKLHAAARRLVRGLRAVLRSALPAGLRARLRRWWGWHWFRGDYPTWAAARTASGGYEAEAILERVLTSTLRVQAGQAAFERDGVLFAEPEPDAPLLAAFEQVRGALGRGLRVLDFGGSLGSTYWRLRTHLPAEAFARWDVVEQPGFVAAGRRHLHDERLRFFSDVREAEVVERHDILLASCVLQYLENPADALAEWQRLGLPYLLLNNVPLHNSGPTRIRVQHVPPSIYPASYPVRFFNRADFFAWLEPGYEVVTEFASEAVWPVDRGMYASTGLLLKRKTPG